MTLGSIIVRLTMNTADFETDAGRAAKVAERRAKEIDSAFKKAGTAIGVALGVAMIGVTAAIKSGIDRMDEMSKAAQKVQMPTEEFSRLTYAGELADVSMETIIGSLGRLTKAQAAATKETSTQARVFKELGIAVADAAGNLRPASAVLEDFADRFVDLKGSPEAMAAGFALFGRSFQEMIPLLKDGAAGLREAGAEADALGKTISTEAGLAAEEFNDNLTRLKGGIQGVWQEIGSELLPQLVDLTENMLAFTQEGSNAKDIADGIASAFKAVAGAASTLAAGFDIVKDRIAGTQEMLIGVRDGVSALFAMDLSKLANAAGKFDQGVKQIANAGADPRAAVTRLDTVRVTAPAPPRSSVNLARLRDALGGGKSGGGAARKKELTEEQKAAEELNRAYDSLKESMADRIGLFNAETEVAKVTYETQQGSLKALDETRKQSLLTQAAELDALKERKQLEEDGKRLIEDLLEPFERVNAEREEARRLLEAGVIAQEDYNRAIEASRTPAEQMLEDLRFEAELLGKTREQQELLTAARMLGAEAATTQGKAALQALADYQAAAKATAEQVEFMDGIRDSFGDFFTSIIDGSKSAKDAFKDLVSDILAQITKLMINRAIEQMFGAYGTTGEGTTGGGFFSSLFGAFANSYGGGRATGGPVSANKFYRVNEDGPEMLSMGGRDYLMTGSQSGSVSPITRSAGGAKIEQKFYTLGIETRRTQERQAQLQMRAAQRALARTGR